MFFVALCHTRNLSVCTPALTLWEQGKAPAPPVPELDKRKRVDGCFLCVLHFEQLI